MSSYKRNESDDRRRDKIREKLFVEIEYQKKILEEEKRESLKFSRSATLVIFSLLSYTIFIDIERYIEMARFSVTAIVVEVGTFGFFLVLVSQYQLLKREIRSILPERPYGYYAPFSARGISAKTLNKIYDINKNTLDKLFDKIKTYSTAWLAVSGGLGSAVLVEIFKEGIADLNTALASILCSALIWSIAQNLYGILNYDLAKKTKDLSHWWIDMTT